MKVWQISGLNPSKARIERKWLQISGDVRAHFAINQIQSMLQTCLSHRMRERAKEHQSLALIPVSFQYFQISEMQTKQ
jgi:hypothetical protein